METPVCQEICCEFFGVTVTTPPAPVAAEELPSPLSRSSIFSNKVLWNDWKAESVMLPCSCEKVSISSRTFRAISVGRSSFISDKRSCILFCSATMIAFWRRMFTCGLMPVSVGTESCTDSFP